MRTIKFRALDGKDWKYFTLQDLVSGATETSEFCDSNLTNWCEWTGLLDKNSKEIFEGDILLWQPGEIDPVSKEFVFEKCKVIFQNGCFCRKVEGHDAESFDYNLGDIVVDKMPFEEIIGDIYSNPDLLEANLEK